jgi:ABC-type transport system involved in multi-copper enzyme maturation permease subunit
MLVFSATQVRRLGQGMPMIPLPPKVRTFLRLDAAGERTRPPRHVWNSPIAWREANARGNRFGGIIARWGFIILGIGAAIYLVVRFHNGSLPILSNTIGARATDQGPAFRLGLLALLMLEIAVITIVAIYMSAGCVSKEREDGTLDLLLTTPVTPQQYVWGKLRGLVSFLSALIAVPVATMAIACLYSLFSGATVSYYGVSGNTGGSAFKAPLIYPEMMLVLPLALVPFVALCVTVGMTWSIKAKGVLGAVIPSVALIGAGALVVGFCGMNAVQNVPVIGAVVNAFSPVTNLIVLVNPIENVNNFLRSPDNNSAAGRMSLFIGALVAAAGYSIVVYTYIGATVKSFDQTVRKLSGSQA